MMLAWMLLATIGTFIPRYMKEIFKDKIVCQVHAWFAVSRKCKLSFQFDIPRGIFRPALQNSFFCFLFFFLIFCKFTQKQYFLSQNVFKVLLQRMLKIEMLSSCQAIDTMFVIITARNSRLQVIYRKAVLNSEQMILKLKNLIFEHNIKQKLGSPNALKNKFRDTLLFSLVRKTQATRT